MRARIGKSLRQTEEKYRRIFEDSKDMVYMTSVDGRHTEVNQAGVDLLGYGSKKEMMQVYAEDTFFYPEDHKRFMNEVIKEGFVKDFEGMLKRKDGMPIDVLISANARRDDSGRIISYDGIIKNISDRKRIEEELVQRTSELEALNETGALINQAIVDLDTFFPIALEKAVSLTGYEMGAVYLLSEEGDSLEMKYHNGHPPAMVEEGKVLKYGEGVSGKAIILKQPVISFMNEYSSTRKASALIEEGIQTLVGFPLLAKGKAIGTITLLSRSLRELSQREINLLKSIGNQIGIALENAQLFSKVAKAKSEWETTFDTVTDLITIRYKDYRILRANKATFKRAGLKPEELIGKRCFEIFYHRDKPCEDCYVTETLKTKKNASGERESKYLNGIFRYYTFPIFDEAGEVIAVVELAREITEEKRLEIEKEVVNNINKILASSPDVKQVIQAVHSELKRVLDSERMTITLFDEEREGFRYFGLEEDDEAEGWEKDAIFPREGTVAGKVVGTGVAVIVQDIAQCDSWIDQKLVLEEMRSSLVFPLEYKGKVFGTMNFGSKEINHFSERHFPFLRQVATALSSSIENSLLLNEIRESEEKYRTVIEGTLDGVCVIGIDYRFKYVNEKFTQILGYNREELIGTDLRDYHDKESKRLLADREDQRKKGIKLSPHFELNILRKDGGVRNAEISARSIKDSKGNVNLIVILKDITEKKRMEEQLLQSEKLRAVGEMASGVAHDFNNALAAILGNTQLMLYSVKDEEFKEALQTIEKVAKGSAQTVRRLQDFTRRKVHQELYRLNVNSIVKDAIEITRPKWRDEAQSKGIRIEMVSNGEEIPPVAGSASELREMITNMVFNAIEAMPEGGRIEIRTFQRGEKVCIEISDTGMGIKEEVRKKIFEPFFTTRPFSNTGLGLSMSYGVIKRMGGEIDVESKVGQGTSFTISLPICFEAIEEAPSLPSTPPLIKKRKEARILVIDDEESVRSVLSRILTQVKYQVNVAKDGEEGIRLFNEKEFDIVLTDLGMPGMSGWDVCRAIKKMNPRTPVGIITGWGMEIGEEKMKEVELDFLISKPFDSNQILNTVAKTMESKRI
jgi:PAS domain S-box-containing protein